MGALIVIASVIGGTITITKAKGSRAGIIFGCLATAYFSFVGGIKTEEVNE